MSLIDPIEALARLESKENLLNRFSPTDAILAGAKRALSGKFDPAARERRGRGKEWSPRMRAIIGAVSVATGPSAAARLVGGADQGYISILDDGRTHPSRGPDPELKAAIDADVKQLHDLALSKAVKAVQVINDDQLKELKPREAASVAKDLATVIERTSPRVPATSNGTAIIFYSPENRPDEAFETITVKAKEVK